MPARLVPLHPVPEALPWHQEGFPSPGECWEIFNHLLCRDLCCSLRHAQRYSTRSHKHIYSQIGNKFLSRGAKTISLSFIILSEAEDLQTKGTVSVCCRVTGACQQHADLWVVIWSRVCAQKVEVTFSANARAWPWFPCQCQELYNGNEHGKRLWNTGMDKQGSALTIRPSLSAQREKQNKKR